MPAKSAHQYAALIVVVGTRFEKSKRRERDRGERVKRKEKRKKKRKKERDRLGPMLLCSSYKLYSSPIESSAHFAFADPITLTADHATHLQVDF